MILIHCLLYIANDHDSVIMISDDEMSRLVTCFVYLLLLILYLSVSTSLRNLCLRIQYYTVQYTPAKALPSTSVASTTSSEVDRNRGNIAAEVVDSICECKPTDGLNHLNDDNECAKSTLTECMEEMMDDLLDEQLLVDSAKTDSQSSIEQKDDKSESVKANANEGVQLDQHLNGPNHLNQVDLNDPHYKEVIGLARGHRLFTHYLTDILKRKDPRTLSDNWQFARQDPFGDLTDYNKYRIANGVEPLDLSMINFNYQPPKEKNSADADAVSRACQVPKKTDGCDEPSKPKEPKSYGTYLTPLPSHKLSLHINASPTLSLSIVEPTSPPVDAPSSSTNQFDGTVRQQPSQHSNVDAEAKVEVETNEVDKNCDRRVGRIPSIYPRSLH